MLGCAPEEELRTQGQRGDDLLSVLPHTLPKALYSRWGLLFSVLLFTSSTLVFAYGVQRHISSYCPIMNVQL